MISSAFFRLLWVLAMGGAGLLSGPAAAEIFKYEDQAGNLYFTDRPMDGHGYRLVWRSGPSSRSSTATRSRVDVASMKRNQARFSRMIKAVAERTHLNPGLLHAVIRAESSYDPTAVSRAGAVGLMQLMPETALRYGVSNTRDPESNLIAGASYLRDLLEMFNYDLKLALAAYNAGENAVKKYGNQIPPFPETQQYVVKVMSFYRQNSQAGI